jgi:hypothetical protein
MAVVSFNLTITAPQVTRLENALMDYFSLPGATNAVLVERYRQSIIEDLKHIVSLYETKAAAASVAAASITPT